MVEGSAAIENYDSYHTRALDDMSDCVLVLGSRGTIVFANDAAISALEIGDYVGKSFASYYTLYPNSENDDFYDVVLNALSDKSSRCQGCFPFVSPSGKRFTFSVTSSYMIGADQNPYLVVTCDDVTAAVEAERLRKESVIVLVSSIVYICIFMFVYATWEFLGQPFEKPMLTRILEVGGIVLGALILRFTSLGIQDLGLGTQNLKHNLMVDGAASLVIIACMAGLKLLLMNVAPDRIVHAETFYDPSWVSVGRFTLYILTAIVQEFLTRGIMQQSLLHVLQSKYAEAIAIIVSTIMFASLHMMYGPLYMLGAAVLLGVFGIVYQRQQSIWGLALVHFCFGMSAAMFGLI